MTESQDQASVCALFRAELWDYLDADLDAQRLAQIEVHLEACPECSAYLVEQVGIELERPEHGAVTRALVAADPVAAESPLRVPASSPVLPFNLNRVPKAALWIAAAALLLVLVRFGIYPTGRAPAGGPAMGRVPWDVERVLASMRAGPFEVNSATYSLARGPNPAEAEVLYSGRLRRVSVKSSPDAKPSVMVDQAGMRWAYDASAHSLVFGASPPTRPSPLDGPALAAYLQNGYDLSYAGPVDEQGVPCHHLTANSQSGDERLDLFINTATGLVHRSAQRIGNEAPLIQKLRRVNSDLAPDAFSPTSYLQSGATPAVDRGGLAAAGLSPVGVSNFLIGVDDKGQAALIQLSTTSWPSTILSLAPELLEHLANSETIFYTTTRERNFSFVPTSGYPSGAGAGEWAMDTKAGRYLVPAEKLRSLGGLEDLRQLFRSEYGLQIELEAGLAEPAWVLPEVLGIGVMSGNLLRFIASNNDLELEQDGNTFRFVRP